MNKSIGSSIQIGGLVWRKKNGSMWNCASYKWAQMTFANQKTKELVAINGEDIRSNVSQSTLPSANSLRCTKILSQHHPFMFLLPSLFLPCKNTFMDDYDGVYNCNSLKYSPFNFFDNFCFIVFYGDQNIG